MKTTTKSKIYVSMASMILITVLAVPAAAQKQVPFDGAMQGREIDTPQGGPPPTTLLVDGRTRGIATHVGQFSFSYQLTVTLANGTATGSAQVCAFPPPFSGQFGPGVRDHAVLAAGTAALLLSITSPSSSNV